MTNRAQILSANLSGAKELLTESGVDPEALATSVNLPAEALERDDIAIEARTFYDFLSAAAEQCQDDHIGIALAERQQWHIVDGLWEESSGNRTVADIVHHMANLLELVSDSATAYTTEHPQGIFFCFEIRWDLSDQELRQRNEPLIVEYALATACWEVRQIFEGNWQPTYVQFRHSSPATVQPLRRCFGTNISFNQDCNAIFLTHEELSHPVPENRDQILKDSAITPLRSHEETFTWAIKTDREIRKSFHEHECSMEAIAAQMGMPVRTLQHQLKREGTCYQDIINRIRMDCAIHYLENSSLSVSEIAERLHFAETSVFSRYFKTQTGTAPSQLIKRRKEKLDGSGKDS